jgi:2-methylcitrate dehydratase PrpD
VTTAGVSLTKQIVQFASELRLDNVPVMWRRKILLHVIDALGCGIAGRTSEVTRDCLNWAKQSWAAGQAPLLTGGTLCAVGSAFINAAAINALDYDDGLELAGKGLGHPGGTLVASALAALGSKPVTGADWLRALIAGWEVNARVIISQQPTAERFRQVYGVCQHQSLGGALVYGLLAGLSGEALANAIGLAGSLTPLPSLHHYNWGTSSLVSLKDYSTPAAESAVKGVELAIAGLVGPQAILDGPQGFWRMMGSDQFDSQFLVDGLGQDWQLRHASFKAWPVCRWLHSALAAFEQLRHQHAFSAEHLDAIDVAGSQRLVDDFAVIQPTNETDTQFSMPWALACLALRIPHQQWSHATTRSNPQVQSLAHRVQLRSDNQLEQWMTQHRRPICQVTVQVNGKRITAPQVSYPPGCEENPLPDSVILDKFLDNLRGHISSATQRQQLLDNLLALENCDDVSAVLEPLWRR